MQDLLPLAERAAAILKQRGETIAVAESSSGGLISAALLGVAGASAYFIGGSVVYTLNARRELLGVPDESLKGLRGLTEQLALVFARAARDRLSVTWGIAEIGAAGPTGSRYGDPAGTTCIAVAGPVERAIKLQTGIGDRVENMRRFAGAALELFVSCLSEPR